MFLEAKMNDRIILRLVSESEKEFFRMLEGNVNINLKQIYMQISRRRTYKMINLLFHIQERVGFEIIDKKPGFDEISKLPIVILERKANIWVEDDLVWIS